MDIENDLQEPMFSSGVLDNSANSSERELLHLSTSKNEEVDPHEEVLSRSEESNQSSDQSLGGNNEIGRKKVKINSSAPLFGQIIFKDDSRIEERDSWLKQILKRWGSGKIESLMPEEITDGVALQPVSDIHDEVTEIQTPGIETVSANKPEIEEPKSVIEPIPDSIDSKNEANDLPEEVIPPEQEYLRAISGAITIEPGAASNRKRWWELNNFAAGESTRDIEADFVKSETFVVAGMSIRGASHQENGAPNQDAFSITFARDYLVAVVSDGVSGAKHSGYGSRYMSTKVSRRIAAELDQQTSVSGTLDLEEIIGSAIAESAKSLMKWTADSYEVPIISADEVSPREMAATLTVAVIPNEIDPENQREMTLAFIGDSPCYILAEGQWNIMTPATKEGLIVENSTAWVPGAVIGEITPDFVRVKVSENDVILLMTDGVSTSLGDGSYPVARFLAPRLAQPQNMGDYFDSLNFDRRGEADDRTLVAIYSQESISGSPS